MIKPDLSMCDLNERTQVHTPNPTCAKLFRLSKHMLRGSVLNDQKQLWYQSFDIYITRTILCFFKWFYGINGNFLKTDHLISCMEL